MWETSGAFKPAATGTPYTVLMPPPNANASLHAGHAMYTIDDIVTRWKRMQGYSTVWIPGMDHAGFETQFVYEKNLAKEGKSRLNFDRKTLYNNIFQFVKNNSGLIYKQFRKLGLSADWDRSVFTLDRRVVERVYETFRRMEREGKVYRDNYMVNYCTHCGTSLSELEVDHEERVDPLYYLRYGPFVLATVRPETKFGDTAVAVHPGDNRYTSLVGKEIEVDGLIGKFKVKVIADEAVDREFGTGAVKVTPAHDPTDFEMGKRHNLEIKQVIGLDGRLNEKSGKYAGLKVAEARKAVVADLQSAGLLEKVDENYKHAVSICYKCKRTLEPTIIPNWFVRINDLKKPVIEAVNRDEVRFFPKKFKRLMLDWLKRMHDWPISRQIVWGIRIPVWYELDFQKENIWAGWLDKEGKFQQSSVSHALKQGTPLSEIVDGLQWIRTSTGESAPRYVVSEEKPADGKIYLPETDTFDTWFSSSQWPLVTLDEHEFATRFPSDFMGTLEDILPFWISRMILFGEYVKQGVPFKQVYLWSKVTDSKGQKMSKSKGNVVNPVDFIDKYGADAVRMALVFGVAPGSSIPFSEGKIRGMRNFANKLWNVARFVFTTIQDTAQGEAISNEVQESLNSRLETIRQKSELVQKKVSLSLEHLRFNDAAEYIYEYAWHEFADKDLEFIKTRINSGARVNGRSKKDLTAALINILTSVHPLMPFVSEAIWQEGIRQNLSGFTGMLIRKVW